MKDETQNEKQELTVVEKQRWVSQAARYVKDYEMFCQFRRRVLEKGNPCIAGPNYVVMTRKHYDEMIKDIKRHG